MNALLWFLSSSSKTSNYVFNEFFFFFSQTYSEMLTNSFFVSFIEHRLNFKNTSITEPFIDYSIKENKIRLNNALLD
jgi:hypothetical protein